MRGVDERGEGPTTYVVSFPRILQLVRCSVPGCPAVAHSTGWLKEHFTFQQFWSQIAVVQEGKEPLPCCNLCEMHMPAGRLVKHLRTAQYDRDMQMSWRIRDVEIGENSTGATFSIMREDGAE